MPRRRASTSKEAALPLDLFEVPVCCLCGLGATAARCYQAPELISLPPLSRSSSSLADLSMTSRYVHEECARYSDGLKEHAAQWLRARSKRGGSGASGQGPALTLPAAAVEKELERTAACVCVVCRKPGAYLTCKEVSCNYSFHLHCAVSAAQINKALFSQQSCELVCCLHEACLGSVRGVRAPMAIGEVGVSPVQEAAEEAVVEPAPRARSSSPAPRPGRRAQSQPCSARDPRSQTPAARRSRGRPRKVSFAEMDEKDTGDDNYKDQDMEKDQEMVDVRERIPVVCESSAAACSPRRTRSTASIPHVHHAPRARSAEPLKRACQPHLDANLPAPSSNKPGLSRYVGCKVRVSMEGSSCGQTIFKEGIVHANTDNRRKKKFPHVIKYLDTDESDEEVRLPDSTVEVLVDKEHAHSPKPSTEPSLSQSPMVSTSGLASAIANQTLNKVTTRTSSRFATKSSKDNDLQKIPEEVQALPFSKVSMAAIADNERPKRATGDVRVHSDPLVVSGTGANPSLKTESMSHARIGPADSVLESESSADESRLSLVMRYRMNLLAGMSGGGKEAEWFYGKTVLLNDDDELKEAVVVRNPGMRRRNGVSSNLPHLLRFVDRRERDQEFQLPDDRVTVLVENPPSSDGKEVSSSDPEATKLEMVQVLDKDDAYVSQGGEVACNSDGTAHTTDTVAKNAKRTNDSNRRDKGANAEAAQSDFDDETMRGASHGPLPSSVGRATRSKGGGPNVQALPREMSSAAEGCGPVTRKTRAGCLQDRVVDKASAPDPANAKSTTEVWEEEDCAAIVVKGPEWYVGRRVLVRAERSAAREAVVHQNPHWNSRAGSRTRTSAPPLPHVLKFQNPEEADETIELPHKSVTVLDEDDVYRRHAMQVEEPGLSLGGYQTRSAGQTCDLATTKGAAGASGSKYESESGPAQNVSSVVSRAKRAGRHAASAVNREDGGGEASKEDPFLGRRVKAAMSKGHRSKEGVVLPNATAKWGRRKMYPHLIRYDDSDVSDEECMLPDSTVTLLPPVAATERKKQNEEHPMDAALLEEDKEEENGGVASVDLVRPVQSDGSSQSNHARENDLEQNTDDASVRSGSTEETKCVDQELEQDQVEVGEGHDKEEHEEVHGDDLDDGAEKSTLANPSPHKPPASSPRKAVSSDPEAVSKRHTRNSYRSAHPSDVRAFIPTSSTTTTDAGESGAVGDGTDSVDQLESSVPRQAMPAGTKVKVISRDGQERFGTLHDNYASNSGRSKQLPQVVRFSDGAEPLHLDVRLPDPRVHMLGDAPDSRTSPGNESTAARSPEGFHMARAGEAWHAGSRSRYPRRRPVALPKAPEAAVRSRQSGSGDTQATGVQRSRRGRAADPYAGRRARVLLDDEYKECVVHLNLQADAKRRKQYPHVLKYKDSDESDEEVKLPLASVEFLSDVVDEGRNEIGGEEDEAEPSLNLISPMIVDHRALAPAVETPRTWPEAAAAPLPSGPDTSSAAHVSDAPEANAYGPLRDVRSINIPAAATSAAASEALAALAALADRPPAPAKAERIRDLDQHRTSSGRGGRNVDAGSEPTIPLAELLGQHSQQHSQQGTPAPVAYQHRLRHNTHPKLAQKAVEADLKRVRQQEQLSSPTKQGSMCPNPRAGNQMPSERSGTRRSDILQEGPRAGSVQDTVPPSSDPQPHVVNLRSLPWGENAKRALQISMQTSATAVAAKKQESEELAQESLAARTWEAGVSKEPSGAQRQAEHALQEPRMDHIAPVVSPGSESTHNTTPVASDAHQEAGSNAAAMETSSAPHEPEQEADPKLAPAPAVVVEPTNNRVSGDDRHTFRKRKLRGQPAATPHQHKKNAVEIQGARAAAAVVDRMPLPPATYVSVESTEGVTSVVEASSSSSYHSTASEVPHSDILEIGSSVEAAEGGAAPMELPPCRRDDAEAVQGVAMGPVSEAAVGGTPPEACDGWPAGEEMEASGVVVEACGSALATTPGLVHADAETIQAARAAVETARAKLETAIQEKSCLANQVQIAVTESPEAAAHASPASLQTSTSMTTSIDTDTNSTRLKVVQASPLVTEIPQTSPSLPWSTRSIGTMEPRIDDNTGDEPPRPPQQYPTPRGRNKRKPSAPTAYNAETRSRKYANASKVSPSRSARRGRRAASTEDRSLARGGAAARHPAPAGESTPSKPAAVSPLDAHLRMEEQAAATCNSPLHPSRPVVSAEMVMEATPRTQHTDEDHHSEALREVREAGHGVEDTVLGEEDPKILREHDQKTSKAEPRATPQHPYVVVAALAVLAHTICGQQPTEVKRLLEQGGLWDKVPRSSEAKLHAESAMGASTQAAGNVMAKGMMERERGACAAFPEDVSNLPTAPMITDWVWAATVAQMMVLPPQGGQDLQNTGDSAANKQKRADDSRSSSHDATKRRRKNAVVDHDTSMQVAEKQSPDVLVLQDVIAKEEHAAVWNIEVLQPVLAKLKAKQLAVAQLQQTSRVHMKSVQEQIEILQSNIAQFKRQNV